MTVVNFLLNILVFHKETGIKIHSNNFIDITFRNEPCGNDEALTLNIISLVEKNVCIFQSDLIKILTKDIEAGH